MKCWIENCEEKTKTRQLCMEHYYKIKYWFTNRRQIQVIRSRMRLDLSKSRNEYLKQTSAEELLMKVGYYDL